MGIWEIPIGLEIAETQEYFGIALTKLVLLLKEEDDVLADVGLTRKELLLDQIEFCLKLNWFHLANTCRNRFRLEYPVALPKL